MNVALCPRTPATTRELAENDPGFTAGGAAPVAATPTVAVAVVAAFAAGYAAGRAAGTSEPVIE